MYRKGALLLAFGFLAARLLAQDANATSSAPLPAKPIAIPATAAATTAAAPRPGLAAPPGPAAGVALPPASVARTASLPEAGLAPETRTVLRNGVRSFLRGDYDGCVKTLSGLSDAGNETARLFTAYALSGSVLAGGREAGPELPRARALFESLPARARPTKPPGVSPRILEALAAPAGRRPPERSP